MSVGHTAEVDPPAKVHGGVNETVVSAPHIDGDRLVIEYVVWTIGIGAACATVLAGWKGPRPEPPYDFSRA